MTQLMTEQGMVRVPAGTWDVDPGHSSAAFEVKHMMITTVRGHFREFGGRLDADEEDPANSQVTGWAKVASIDTGNAERVTREVEMTATVEGAAEDPWGNERVGISVRGTIDRTHFGLTWQQGLQGGGLLVGEKVSILLDVSAVRAA
jgi:polyisoprenoid-binding protein YceI